MSLQNDIQDLVTEGIINNDTADQIRDYYKRKKGTSSNRLFAIFGILGALLIGFGMIMIIGHNWDDYSKSIKLIFAFAPLIIAQGLGVYVILKKLESLAWRETVGLLIFFGIGASITLISQIYNIATGDLSTFLMAWSLLALPIVYLLRSSAVSMIYICFITYFCIYSGFWRHRSSDESYYWLMLLGILPYYYYLFVKTPNSNFLKFHNWLIPLSVGVSLCTLVDTEEWLMFPVYFVLGSLFYMIGNTPYFEKQKLRNNSYKILGVLGSIVTLLILTYTGLWEERGQMSLNLDKCSQVIEFWVLIFFFAAALGLLVVKLSNKGPKSIRPFDVSFIVVSVLGISAEAAGVAMVFMNLFVLGIAILYIFEGLKRSELQRLNFGLIVAAILIGIRFLDADLSFVAKGVVFLLLGAGFFATNVVMYLKKKNNEK